MCDLAATGADGRLALVVLAIGVAAVVLGLALVLKSRAAVAALGLAVVVGMAALGPVPAASAACPEASPTVPAESPATIGLIIGDQVSRFTGPASRTVDVENLSATATARDVTVLGSPPVGWSVDSSACLVIPPGGSCSIVIALSGAAMPETWSYTVAGSNTNTVADSMTFLAATTLTLSPTQGVFTIPGDSALFVLTNTGAVDAAFLFVTLSGADPGAYAVVSNTCPFTLPAGSSCQLSVSFGIPAGTGQASLEVSAVNADPLSAPLQS